MGGKPLQFVAYGRHCFAGLAALILLSGCKPVGPNYSRPVFTAPPAYKETGASTAVVPPPNPNGGTWQPASPSDGMLRGKWWEIYQDPQLNQLEEHIATDNQNLRSAVETYLAARDQIADARSAFYPTLSAGPSVRTTRCLPTGRWRLQLLQRVTTTLYWQARRAGSRISGGGYGGRWRRRGKLRRPAPPTWQRST